MLRIFVFDLDLNAIFVLKFLVFDRRLNHKTTTMIQKKKQTAFILRQIAKQIFFFFLSHLTSAAGSMLLNLYSIYQTLNKSMYKVNIYCYKYTHFR